MRSKRKRKRRRKTRRQRRRGGEGTRNPRAQTRRADHRLEVPWDEKDYTAKTPPPPTQKKGSDSPACRGGGRTAAVTPVEGGKGYAVLAACP